MDFLKSTQSKLDLFRDKLTLRINNEELVLKLAPRERLQKSSTFANYFQYLKENNLLNRKPRNAKKQINDVQC